MTMSARLIAIGALAVVAVSTLAARQSPSIDAGLLRELSWRHIGPQRGGRVTAVAGTAAQPNVFYTGSAGGGVWRTTDAGQTWQPVFDDQPTGAIGALAVAPSDSNVIYAGTGADDADGRLVPGSGFYRSRDAGRTWRNTGLSDSSRIQRIAVAAQDAERLYVAVSGGATGGLYRSTNGGDSFERVLFVDDETGATDVDIDPTNPDVAYAVFERLHAPPAASVFRTSDGGRTWTRLDVGHTAAATNAPTRIALAIAPDNPRRVLVAARIDGRLALIGSDDGGQTWAVRTGANVVAAPIADTDPLDVAVTSDAIYVVAGITWQSRDGGATFASWYGAGLGGDDHVWVNPLQPSVAIVAGNGGASVTVNGGATWSDPDGLRTSSFDRVSTDTAFPFRVCAASMSEPAGCVLSRSVADDKSSDWAAVGTSPSGSVATDPTDPDIVFTGALGRFDRRVGQVQNVTPPLDTDDRIDRHAPLAFSPAESRALYFASTRVWKSTTSGQAWTAISPRLTPEGAISVLAPSPIDARTLWAAGNDGSVHVTKDGGLTWNAAALPMSTIPLRIGAIEPSHFDTSTAYVARVASSSAPDLLRTRDGGSTWTPIVTGVPAAATTYVVREDPFRRGLLFAGTDRGVLVSFDDGDRWQALTLNLPPVPVRDLATREADLVAATAGRGLWILDDVSPLRQITPDIARSNAFLFRPATAWRVRAGLASPSSVAALHYLIGPNQTGPVSLEIIESATGDVLRRFSSEPAAAGTGVSDSTEPISRAFGLHRVIWDLQYAPIDGRSVAVLPGVYQVRLSVGNTTLRQAISIRMDPRVRTSTPDLAAQYKLARSIDDKRRELAAVRPSTPAIDAARAALTAALGVVQQADARPTAATEALAADAIAHANDALAGVAHATR